MPDDLKSAGMEKAVAAKPEVVDWLKRSFDAVKKAHAGLAAPAMQKKVNVEGRDATVDGIYLRILVHANEHMVMPSSVLFRVELRSHHDQDGWALSTRDKKTTS
jgi:hypothetical protein